MKNLFKLDIKLIALIVLVIIILLQQCGGNNKPGGIVKIEGKPYEVIKHDIDTQYIPKYNTISKKGKDIYHDTTIYVPVDKIIDTNEILKDFYSKNIYNDTIQLGDSLGFISITDTITKNKILSRIWNSKMNKVIVKETMIVKQLPKNQFYIGIDGGFNSKKYFSSIGTGIILKTKSDKIYKFSIGLDNNANDVNLTPYFGLGIYWKIKF